GLPLLLPHEGRSPAGRPADPAARVAPREARAGRREARVRRAVGDARRAGPRRVPADAPRRSASPVTLPLLAHGHFGFGGFGAWEWVLFVAEAAVFVWVLWLTVRWTLRPGEEDPNH